MGMLLKSYQVAMLFVYVLFIFVATDMRSGKQIESERVTLHVEDSQVFYNFVFFFVSAKIL